MTTKQLNAALRWMQGVQAKALGIAVYVEVTNINTRAGETPHLVLFVYDADREEKVARIEASSSCTDEEFQERREEALPMLRAYGII